MLKDIIETNQFPKDDDKYYHLVLFLLVSEGRNLKLADSTNHMADFMAKEMLKVHPDFKDMDLDAFKIELSQPASLNLEAAMKGLPLVVDLEPILIVEQTGARKFITSDNPLVRYNSFYLSKNYPRGFGYITRGLQLFFPISPRTCILLYDSVAYDIPEKRNGILTLKKARDVDLLNELFYLNAYNNVFFNQTTKKDYIEGIHYKNSRTPKINDLEREIVSYNSTDSNSKLIAMSPNKVNKKINFPWIKNSDYTNSLKIPAHMGGLNRMESPFIRKFLEQEKKKYGHGRQPSSEKYFREEI
nr:DUF4238 domain-containing protein [Cytobacillus solani]